MMSEQELTSLDTSGLTSAVLAQIEAGTARITAPGQTPGRPVVRNVKTGHPVKGSGRERNANDIALVAKTTGFKRSRAYNEALEQLMPAWKGDSEAAVSSLEELLEAVKKVTTDTTARHDVKCPECAHEWTITIAGRPDPKVLTFMVERLVGAAKKTEEVTSRSEEVIRVMNDQRVLHSIEVIDLTPKERAERVRQVMLDRA